MTDKNITADRMPQSIWIDFDEHDFFDADEFSPDILMAKKCAKYTRADLVPHQQPGAGMAVDLGSIKIDAVAVYLDTVDDCDTTIGDHVDWLVNRLAAQGLLKTPDAGGDAERAEALNRMECGAKTKDMCDDLTCPCCYDALTSQPDVRGMILLPINLDEDFLTDEIAMAVRACVSREFGDHGNATLGYFKRIFRAGYEVMIEAARSGGKG